MAKFPSKRVVAIGAAALAVAGGTGVAVGATTSGGSPSDFLDSVASHLGISRQKLDDATKAAAFIGDGLTAAAKYLGLSESDLQAKLNQGQSLADVAKAQSKDVNGLEQAIVAAEKADLDKAVTDKKITQSQADDILSGLKSRIDDLVNGKLRFGGPGAGGLRGGPGFPGGTIRLPLGDQLGAAAKYLGLSASALRDKLSSGQSLADVAKAQSKDVSGLEQAIVAAEKADLDKAVADKKITQTQADKVLSGLKSRVDDLVNAKGGARGAPFRGRMRGGPRFFFGP